MKVGDLIKYKGELHMVANIHPTAPKARKGLETVVLVHCKTLKRDSVPMKWIGSSK